MERGKTITQKLKRMSSERVLKRKEKKQIQD